MMRTVFINVFETFDRSRDFNVYMAAIFQSEIWVMGNNPIVPNQPAIDVAKMQSSSPIFGKRIIDYDRRARHVFGEVPLTRFTLPTSTIFVHVTRSMQLKICNQIM
jgi:hypothetical protein